MTYMSSNVSRTICQYKYMDIGTAVDLWGQYVSYLQHTAARVPIEEKFESNLLPCD